MEDHMYQLQVGLRVQLVVQYIKEVMGWNPVQHPVQA